MFRSIVLASCALVFVGASVCVARADALFGIDADTSTLVQIDTKTGEATEVGPIGVGTQRVNGLSFSPSGELFSSLWGQGAGPETLWRLDPLSGGGTYLQDLPDICLAAAIAFSPRGLLYGTDAWSDLLYSIDLETGELTVIGHTGYSYLVGLSWGPDEQLYATDGSRLFRVSPETASAAEIGETGAGFLEGLAFDSSGVLYGVDTSARSLLQIDPSSGAATLIGSFEYTDMNDIAFVPELNAGLLVLLVTNQEEYRSDDFATISIVVENPEESLALEVEVKLSCEYPNGNIVGIINRPTVVVPAGRSVERQVASHLFRGDEPEGVYTLILRFLDPVTGEEILYRQAMFRFTP